MWLEKIKEIADAKSRHGVYKLDFGIYRILNLITGKSYIGSCSWSFKRRFTSHRCGLKNNRHHSKRLQSSWNKYGESAFVFGVLENCNKEEIIQREQYWIDFYDSYDKGYNACPTAMKCYGRPVSQETRDKIRNTLKTTHSVYTRTPEHLELLSKRGRKQVYQLNKEGDIINTFKSQREAAISLNVSQSCISSICNNQKKSRRGLLLTMTV